ncbi:glycoside hydrolase family 13 protein [Xylaria cf. heliscus]|nr:glycoside hydrolase family 13 protein [Xylaria cf. heliscus]
MASPERQELLYSTAQWWKEAIVYQVYPSSFQSHQGAATGWGSIKGITSRLDYLKSLGIDVVWSSPFFKSPQADMGYDIADYKDIDSRYGTLEDVDDLISGLRERNMKLVVDLVVNHTSNQHPWFLESRSCKDNPKRDWYIWRKPRQSTESESEGHREPPNNWAQILGEANSAWKYDPVTDEYYLCLFTPEQPDLNWENPEVRAAIWDIMHFWLKRGASGFRLDVINMISKVPEYPDADIFLDPRDHKYQPALKYFVNGPRLHDYLREMYREVLSKYDAITVGEMPGVSDENEILKTVGANAGELRMIFIFDLVDIDKPNIRMALKPWDLKEMKAIVTRWQRVMIEKNGWNSVFIENHDNPRSVSRYTDDSDQYRDVGAKLLALMQTTLGGTLFVYQGEELGMRNVPKSWDIEEYKDIETINYWDKVKKIYAEDPERLQHGRAVIEMKARDHARTPMQWDASPNAGFCDASVTPWMRVNDDYKTVNVEAQMRDGDANADLTVLQFWQQSIRRRKEHAPVFVYGDFEEITPEHPNVFAYLRTSTTGEKWLVVLNYFGRQVEWHIPSKLRVESWVCGTYGKGQVGKPQKGIVPLKPWEGLLAKCT